MGVLQQSFNQALTGATFLLQQTPMWKEMADTQKELSDLKKIHNSLPGLAAEADIQGKAALAEASDVPEGMATEQSAQEAIDQGERLTNRYRAAQNEIQIKRTANPSLNKKFQRYEDRMNQKYGDASTRDEWDVSQAERNVMKARQMIAELQDQYTSQKANTDSFKKKLKAGNERTTKAKQILRELQGGKK